MKTVVRRDASEEKLCRIYVKGAPEELIPLCTQTLDPNVQTVEFSEHDRQNVLGIIENKIAKKGYKPLSYAVRIISREDLDNALPNVSEDSPQYRNIFESDLIYLGTFGLVDPLREGIQDTINLLQYGVENPEPK